MGFFFLTVRRHNALSVMSHPLTQSINRLKTEITVCTESILLNRVILREEFVYVCV